MAFGVETRIPFLDHRLVELVLPLPGAAKLAGGKTKALLRDAVDGVVPATIILDKQHRVAAVYLAEITDDKLRDTVSALLAEEGVKA